MPVRFGVTFPAWFSPTHPPTPPVKPSVPEKIKKEPVEVEVDSMYFSGMYVTEIMNRLRHYESNNYFVISEGESLKIMKIDYKETVLDEKEYAKALKEHERKIKEYEKLELEYQSRMKKYPGMVAQHDTAKYTNMLANAEDTLEDIKVEQGINELAIQNLLKEIKLCKEKISEINNDKQDSS